MNLREFLLSDSDAVVVLLNNYTVSKYLSSRVSTGCKNGFIRAITENGKPVGCIGVEMGQFEESRTGEMRVYTRRHLP